MENGQAGVWERGSLNGSAGRKDGESEGKSASLPRGHSENFRESSPLGGNSKAYATLFLLILLKYLLYRVKNT